MKVYITVYYVPYGDIIIVVAAKSRKAAARHILKRFGDNLAKGLNNWGAQPTEEGLLKNMELLHPEKEGVLYMQYHGE